MEVLSVELLCVPFKALYYNIIWPAYAIDML